MKARILFLVAFLLCATTATAQVERQERGNLVLENIPDIPAEIAERLQQYQNTRSASLLDWMPDEPGLLISTRFGETSQLHVVDLPGGARRQITFFDEPVGGASVSPNPDVNGFLFSKDVGGSEFYQIFFHDFETGSNRMLTDGASRNGGALWANDGRRFAYFTTRRNGSDWDVHVMDHVSGSTRAVVDEGGTWMPIDWAPEDDRLLVLNYVSVTESYPYVVDLSSGDLTPLHAADEPIAYGGAVFSGDGSGLYYTSDEDSEFHRLRHLDFASGETRVLTADIDWDVQSAALSEDGRRLSFTVNEEGYSTLYLMDTVSEDRVPVPLPMGLVGGLEFSRDGERLAFTLNQPTSPGDVFLLDLEDVALTRWTYSETGGLNPETFKEPQLIRYETFDEVGGARRTIPAFVYRPKGAGPFPVLIDIHGGPESQERPSFSSWTQFVVNELGVAVIAPNVRGSNGYGKSYLKLDNAFKREDSVRDIGALLDWIAVQSYLNEDRVAVMGGSYGGYMVLSSMAHFDDRLRAGIDVVGISNFVTFLENTQDYRRDLRRAEYGDERDPEMRKHLMSISPTTMADRITKPLFVAQGLNDPRVPASESEQMVDVIRENGGTVWYMLARDEGHGFRKKSNRDFYMQASALFLREYLLDKPRKTTGR